MDTTKKVKSDTRYLEAVGRRKTAVARVRMTESTKNSFIVNDKEVNEYFPTEELQTIVNDPVAKAKLPAKYTITVLTNGGGIHSQAEAVRHGISRIVTTFDEEIKKKLKKLGFLKRDPRKKERKKFGLKKARKAPTWSKR